MATAHSTAFTTLPNSARMPSPAGVDHPTMVARDHRKHDGKVILQVADGPRLVGPHQGAIANNVGRKNCRQSADNSRIFAGLRHCQVSHSAQLGLPSTSPITLCLTFGQTDWERIVLVYARNGAAGTASWGLVPVDARN